MSGDTLKLANPQDSAVKGKAASGRSGEESIAQALELADYNERIAALEKNNAALEKRIADKKKHAQTDHKSAKHTGQGTSRHVAHATGWKAICSAPDLCKVGKDIIAFDSFATLDHPHTASPNVKARGTPVYRKGDLFKTVQADAGRHIDSGTSLGSGHVRILDGQDNVKANGMAMARHDSTCMINCDAGGKGGAKGKLVTEQKSVGAGGASTATNPDAPPGQRTSDKLERLQAARDKLASGQLDLDALDAYVNFREAHQALDGYLGQLGGTPGTVGDYAAQAGRGVLGFAKDVVTGVGELAYEGIKAVPKLARSQYTATGQALNQLNAAILVENINLGNITPATIGQSALTIGSALVNPVTDPWGKGQHVESVTRGVAEAATLPLAWFKGSKAVQAAKAAMIAKAENAGASVAGHMDGGVHVKANGVGAAGGNKAFYPPGLNFNQKIPEHLSGPDGFSQKSGISGTHNIDDFMQAASQSNARIVSKTPGSIDGIFKIEYQIPSLDSAGKIAFDATGVPIFKNEFFKKTVYDPSFFSNAFILDLGQQAAASGYKSALENGVKAFNSEAGGVPFRVYVDPKTGLITNFHPR